MKVFLGWGTTPHDHSSVHFGLWRVTGLTSVVGISARYGGLRKVPTADLDNS